MSVFIENAILEMRVISGTTSATIGTETSHAHGGTRGVPKMYLIKTKKSGNVYESKAADATYIYLKGSAASITFDAIILWW